MNECLPDVYISAIRSRYTLNIVDKLFIFAFSCQNAKIYIHR